MSIKVAENQRYFVNIDWENQINGEMYLAKCYSISHSNDIQKINEFYVEINGGGDRQAISNDGKYIATAKYESKLFIYDIQNKEKKLFTNQFKSIQKLEFCDNYLCIVSEDNHIYYFDFENNVILNKFVGTNVIKNYFGADIIIKNHNMAIIGTKKVKSNDSCYLDGITTEYGVVLSEMRGNLYCYNYLGKVIWKVEAGSNRHFINLGYNLQKKIIVAICFDYFNKSNPDEVFLIDAVSGSIISKTDVERREYVFIQNCQALLNDDKQIVNILPS